MNLAYDYFPPPADVVIYRRIKRWSMVYARFVKEELADMVGGTIGDGTRSKKQFLNTPRGVFRVATATNSDNTTEIAAHRRMGVKFVTVDDDQSLSWFFSIHGLDPVHARNELADRLHERYGGYLSDE